MSWVCGIAARNKKSKKFKGLLMQEIDIQEIESFLQIKIK